MKGYRAFRVCMGDDDVFLQPAVVGRVALEYPDGAAVCGRGHRAPQAHCLCGYYAYKDLGGGCDYATSDGMIMAEVWGHGNIEEHSVGWRAQRMQIVNFFWPLCNECSLPAHLVVIPDSKAWPSPIRFLCDSDAHRREIEYHGHQVMLELFTPDVQQLELLLQRLSQRFQAGVYGVEETLKAVQANVGWTDRIWNTPVKRDVFREWQNRVDMAQKRAKYAAQQAQGKMHDLVEQVPVKPWWEA